MYKPAAELSKSANATGALTVVDMLHDMPIPAVTGEEHKWCISTLKSIEANPDPWRLEQLVQLSIKYEYCCSGSWAILALTRLRKPVVRQEEPELDDLLGSVELAHKAKRVFFLVPATGAALGAPNVPVSLVVKKARHGQSVRVPLVFHPAQFRFEEQQGPPARGAGKKGGASIIRTNGVGAATPPPAIDPLAGLDE